MSATIQATRQFDFSNSVELFVDLSFPVRGSQLPADHGYALLSAITKYVPNIKEHHDIAILTTAGFGDREGKILLTEHSHFRLRLPVTKIPMVYSLAGKELRLGLHKVHLGIPTVHTLKPCSHLRSRIVLIKGYEEPTSFLSAAKRQLEALEVQGELLIPSDRYGQLARKTIKIKRFTVVGFTVDLTGLNVEDSLKLQVYGLGGKRHMGCGVFIPVKE